MLSDVVIVGGGAAGLSAAITAVEAGCDPAGVLLAEVAPELGGAARMSGGGLCLVGTKTQAEHGVADTVDLAHQDWLAAGGGKADAAWARNYLRDSNAELFDWLSELGLTWRTLNRQEQNSVARWHAPDGAGPAIVAALSRRLAQLGVVAQVSTSLRRLDVRDGEVHGVVLHTPTGLQYVQCRAVVLATGGFVNNAEKVAAASERHWEGRRILCGGAPYAQGNGHDVLASVGAKFVDIDEMAVYPVGTPNTYRGLTTHGFVVRGITDDIWLNSDGRRFQDERLRGGASGGRALLRQPGATCWAVADARGMAGLKLNGDAHFGLGDENLNERAWETLRSSPFVTQHESLTGALDRAGLPVETAMAEIEALNAAVRTDGTDPMSGEPVTGRHEVATGPFTVIQYFPIAQKNLGGVATDLDCTVQDKSGALIRGLLAAGEIAGMGGGHINGAGALEGTMLGPSLYSGKVAGRTAAALVGAHAEAGA